MADSMLPEGDWDGLLDQINAGNVVPIVGPGMATIDRADGTTVTLDQHLAPKFAEALRLENPAGFASLPEVARTFLHREERVVQARNRIKGALAPLLEKLAERPSRALRLLASMGTQELEPHFNLFISTTPDWLLATAIEDTRRRPDIYRFTVTGRSARMGQQQFPTGDVPRPSDIKAPVVYHAFGDMKTDWALLEDDYIEFICGLLQSRKQNTLANLFSLLQDKTLLILGAPADDWIARFFLRATRDQPPTERDAASFIIDQPARLGGPLISFIRKSTPAVQVLEGSPVDFALELGQRWRQRNGLPEEPPSYFKNAQRIDLPPRAIFLSYTRADEEKALMVAEALRQQKVPVWFDRQQLLTGKDFNLAIQPYVQDGCSFFVSLISRSTKERPDSYAQLERKWAAQKQSPGLGYFYFGLILDDTDPRDCGEPPEFSSCHRETFAKLDLFVSDVAKIYHHFKATGFRTGPPPAA